MSFIGSTESVHWGRRRFIGTRVRVQEALKGAISVSTNVGGNRDRVCNQGLLLFTMCVRVQIQKENKNFVLRGISL